jgi:hypothetical protein
MTEIFRDETITIRAERDALVLTQDGIETVIYLKQLETVTELTPHSTFGKFYDAHVIAIKRPQEPLICIPVTRAGAHRILQGIQQFKLSCLRVSNE